MQTVTLKKNEDRRILAGHLWIYSNEINAKISPLNQFQPGELILIKNHAGKNLGIGYINPHTLLCARLLTREITEVINHDFFVKRIKAALKIREACFALPYYRVIFSESDFLPGLIVDRFADILVAQITTAGMENLKEIILEALITVLKPKAILWRNDSNIRTTENLEKYVTAAFGNPEHEVILEENKIKFIAPIWEGQKTGWFYDQRINRQHLQQYAKNKSILDVCCYTGGFGVSAAAYGASEVLCLDSSETALNVAQRNAELNKVKINTLTVEMFTGLGELKNQKQQYDVIILDPPAFIKRQKDLKLGTLAYLKLHKLALQLLTADGVLFTTSCSQHFTRELLLDVIRQASLQTQQPLTALHQLHQGPDHPLNVAISTTDYLKGFILKLCSN